MDTALDLVSQWGLDALTIRALADALGVSSPAIYHYVANKDELIRRVCDQVTRRVTLDDDPEIPWEERVVRLVLGMHRTYASFPGVGNRALSLGGPAPAAAAISDHLITIVMEAGYSRFDAVQLCAAVHFQFSGWLLGRPPFLNNPRLDPATGEADRHGSSADSSTVRLTDDLLESGVRFLLVGFIRLRKPDGQRG
jgi:TetR/AcrR family transcriptional regulator, tetracycline repressor protein